METINTLNLDCFLLTALSCKTRWVNIRDNLRRKIRERERKPCDTQPRNFKYKYEDELSFILPFFKGILQETNEDAAYEDISEYNNEVDDFSEMKMSVFIHSDTQSETDQLDVKPEISQLFDSDVDNREDVCASSSKTCTTVRKRGAVSTSQEKLVDPIGVFLEAVDSTLRVLNPYYLNVAKSKIFQVVQDCELQQILNKGEPPPS